MTTIQANGSPTKEFFVWVLGKDIPLVAAIIDLVDNSVDGARRLRGEDASLKGLWIHIEANAKLFTIADNCGGISIEIAKDYAFRFGRPPTVLPRDYATGQFGVGMKRALFKLGDHFTVASATATSSFETDVSVAQWLKQPEQDWHFDLSKVRDKVTVAKDKIGTRIAVDSLHKTISDDLNDEEKLGELREGLRQRHMLSINKGLVIKLNGDDVRVRPPKLIDSTKVRPAFQRFELNGSGAPIKTELLCGVSDGDQRDAGWSVFLNDRMVLLKDKSELTGWGNKDTKRIPRFHGQYGRFRGYAFLTCSDTTRLPWDTTKTGLDVDSPYYRLVESRMVALMEPVVRFLDDVDTETTHVRNGGNEGPLLQALEVEEGTLFDVLAGLPKKPKTYDRAFHRPAATIKKPPPANQSIQFRRPRDEIETMKDFFDVTSAGAAGEAAWEYVLEAEEL